MALTDTSIRRPIATAMIYLIIITLGLIGFRFLPVDLLPPIEYPRLTVFVSYPNVGPEEIEQIIVDPLENAVSGVPNVDQITSSAQEGSGRVNLTFAQGVNLDEAANDVRAALDRVRDDLPLEADPPRIWKFDPNDSPIVVIGARSSMKLGDLTRILERDITKRFEQVPGVGTVDVWGGVNEEVHINVQRDRLFAYNLTAQDLVAAVSQENANLPGGNLRSGFNDLYVRTLGEFKNLDEIRNSVVSTQADGRVVRVGDVAEVDWAYGDVGRIIMTEDEPIIRFFVRKQSGSNTVTVSEQVRKEVERVNAERSDMQLLVMTDQAEFIQESINNVKNSAIWGAVLAVIVLFAFLRNTSTVFVIGIAIPISIIATFALLYFNGLTLNQMSFGGLALGVGLIVDNSIVVLENIVRLIAGKRGKKEAASVGTKQVAGAIIASTLTTTVIFLPVVFMNSITGLLFQELALVVVFALLCSLFVALTLVPMISSRFLSIRSDEEDQRTRMGRFFKRLDDKYASMVEWCLGRKSLVAGSVLGAFLVAAWFAPQIPMELAPQTDANEVEIRMNMDDGFSIGVTREYAKELERLVHAFVPEGTYEYMTTDIRNSSAEIEITLPKDSPIDSYELADELRAKLDGQIPGARIRVQAQTGLWILRRLFNSGGGGDALEVELRGYEIEMADKLAEDIKTKMERISGIVDVEVSRREGRPEQNLIFNREKIAQLGLSVRQVSRVVQTNLGGSIAGRFRKSGDEFDIIVRLQEKDRLSAMDIDNISLRSAQGQIVPLTAVVEKEINRGPTEINRVDGQRTVRISANLEEGVTLGQAVERVRATLTETPLPSGFSIVFGGEYEEQQKAAADFQLAIVMALILVYMVMAAQFERFLDPLIVMFSVPIAIIGIVPTMMLTGTTLNLNSLMGVIMLAGIVVNNAIVLVDYINLLRREQGMTVHQAVVEAGRLRLRPILMTTLTTILGLIPLSFGGGAGGEIQASLARVVIGGMAASTVITLFFIPVIYQTVAIWKETLSAKWIAYRGRFKQTDVEIANS